MKESFWGYWIIVLGIFVVIIMMLVSNVTTTNTQDYYLVKDVTEASLVDAVDYSYYRQYKELKINREKFIENFLRRFAENVSLSTYTIDFYDIYEAPPKASVKITTESGSFIVNGDSSTFDIVNRVDAILELSGNASSNDSVSSSYKETTTGKDFIGSDSSSSGNVNKGPFTLIFNSKDGKTTSKTIEYFKTISDLNLSLYSTPGNWHCWIDTTTNECFPENRAVTQDMNLVETNMPTPTSIIGFAVSVRTNNYYDCNSRGNCTLKSQYYNNREYFKQQLLSDWQTYYNINFSAQERETFLKNAEELARRK